MAIETSGEPPLYSPTAEWPLWFGVLAGPGAWGFHLLTSYGLASLFVCEMGWLWLLHVITVVAAILAALGTGIAWRQWTRRDETVSSGLHGIGSRPGFMALFGVLVSGLSLLGILMAGVPNFVIDTCA